MDTVRVDLAGRGYDIRIGPGLIGQAGAHIGPLLARPATVIVTDETVAGLHLEALEAGLAAAGIGAEAIVLPPGEATKSMAELTGLLERLLALKVERDDLIVALGGGVIGDLVGFAAAVLRRGVDVVQVPTTLLAQVDSSVGGKTGVNAAAGKNLIGAFHQPRLVLADTDVLETLPDREFLAGYAEVVKYGLLGDAKFFEWLEKNAAHMLAGDQAARIHAVRRCCEMKAAIVARDEFERGDRALLNLGHTFGHALEAATGYSDRLLHGEGVAIGLVLADMYALETLPDREFLAGYGEVAKYGLLGDATFFEWLEKNAAHMLAGDQEARIHAVRRCCEMKAGIVARDEFERGDRALLNLGHTFGHALEAATGYSARLLHGEGVAIGMALAFEASARMGLCAQECPSRVRAHLAAMGMKKDLADIEDDLPDADGLMALMGQDKKVRQGRLTFILARGIGEAFVERDADLDVVRGVLGDAWAGRG